MSLTLDLEYDHSLAVLGYLFVLPEKYLFYLKNICFVLFSPEKHKSSATSTNNEKDPSRNNIRQLRKQLMDFVYTVGQTFSVRKFCVQLTLFPIFSPPFAAVTHECHPKGKKKKRLINISNHGPLGNNSQKTRNKQHLHHIIRLTMVRGVDTQPYLPEIICSRLSFILQTLNVLLSSLLEPGHSKFFADSAIHFDLVLMML